MVTNPAETSRRWNEEGILSRRLIIVVAVTVFALSLYMMDWEDNGDSHLTTIRSKPASVTSNETTTSNDDADSVPLDQPEETSISNVTSSPTTAPTIAKATSNETTKAPSDATNQSMSGETTPQNTSQETSDQDLSGSLFCLEGPLWGRDFHQIIQVANLLDLIHDHANDTNAPSAIALNEERSQWYTQWFEDRPEVVLNRTQGCAYTITPQEAFRLHDFGCSIPALQTLIPKPSIQEQAQEQVRNKYLPDSNNASLYISVHRPHMDPELGHLSTSFCLGDDGDQSLDEEQLLFFSNLVYDNVLDEISPGNTTVVLFTDGQRRDSDATFPIIDNHPSSPIKSWMMVLSDVHYGSPMSPVDYVVAHWRHGGKNQDTRPSVCYASTTCSTNHNRHDLSTWRTNNREPTTDKNTPTLAPTKQGPSEPTPTSAPTKNEGTTSAPTTKEETTSAPTTKEETTSAPTTNEGTTSAPTTNEEESKAEPPGPICLQGRFYGKNFNRIIQIANVLSLREHPNQKVALDRRWTMWYLEWFDPMPDEILLNYNEPDCGRVITPKDAHFLRSLAGVMPELFSLIPKASTREEASLAMPTNTVVVSVHRRNMDGQCDARSVSSELLCMNSAVWTKDELMKFCNIVYSDVAANETGKQVILFTDGQEPELDATFPWVDNHSFPVQTWMMATSTIHHGNPMSSVDFVVAHWRKGNNTLPTKCYENPSVTNLTSRV